MSATRSAKQIPEEIKWELAYEDGHLCMWVAQFNISKSEKAK